MTKKKWQQIITESCEKAGTYRDSFESTIETLAEILETRDACQKQYKAEGSRPIVVKVNVKGGENMARNPLLDTVIVLNTQALAYWRELGLTPSGLKKINEKAMESEKKKSGLADMVANLLGEE